jgi:hypothetical protein
MCVRTGILELGRIRHTLDNILEERQKVKSDSIYKACCTLSMSGNMNYGSLLIEKSMHSYLISEHRVAMLATPTAEAVMESLMRCMLTIYYLIFFLYDIKSPHGAVACAWRPFDVSSFRQGAT